MALTGLQIYKLLPQTNCKECGFPTCLAFAMKLAQKGTELDKCPYVSDEAKTALDAASAPPIKLVTIGAGERAFAIGNEVAMFRHEKTFYHQPGLVARVKSDDPALAERGVAWEVSTATTLLEAGADVLVLRHPGSLAVMRDALDDLVKGA